MNRHDAKNTKKNWARRAVPLLAVLVTACAVVQAPEHTRVALFAAFEGRYREVGYNALYAARLALSDAGEVPVDLLAVDDGGAARAADHARGIAADPLVTVMLVIGYDASGVYVQQPDADDLPKLMIGDWWNQQPSGELLFWLSNPQIAQEAALSTGLTDLADQAPTTAGDMAALDGFAKLTQRLDQWTVISSGTLPDADFSARYPAGDRFAPQPGLLATLTYDAMRIAVEAAQTGSREAAREFIADVDYSGLNGEIRFQNGGWINAPIHSYHYVDGALTADDSVK